MSDRDAAGRRHGDAVPATGVPPTAGRPDAGNAPGSLGSLATRAATAAAEATAAAVGPLFRRDPALSWVVLAHPDSPVPISRSWFESTMSAQRGRRRRRLADLATCSGPALPAGTPVALAAAEVLARRADGQSTDVLVVTWPDGHLGVVAASAVFEQVATQYAHHALHDPLTGLPNRLFLLQRLAELGSDGGSRVLCHIDLDRFKHINDDLGHAAGDDVLVEFARRLRSVARADDLVVRLGGDEFAVLTGTPLTPAQTSAFAERVVAAAAAPFAVHGADGRQLVSLGASVGVAGRVHTAAAEVREASPDGILRRADLAVSQAKSLGRGRVVHYADDLLADAATTDAARARHDLERRLRHAVERGHLSLHYQPVVSLPSGQVTGVEALARWDDPELGSVPPDTFIPVAEQTGLIVDLGRWVLETACRAAAGWSTGPSGLAPSVAVNVSPVQLAQRGFVQDVTTALAGSGLAPDRLCLEITETAAITDLAATAARLGELRELGVRLALDDFGSGHSSLTLLRTLPVLLVKIDRSFVDRVTRDTADATLVRLVIEAAHSLGRLVCAEGVETVEQARQLIAMGCDAAQGWLFGRAEPASAELARALHDGSVGLPVAVGEQLPVLPLGGSDELVLATTPDRVITYASASSGSLLGWLPQELIGMSVLDVLHPADRDRLASGAERTALYSDVLQSVVHRVMHRSGAVRWFESTTRRLADEQGAVREVLSVSRDVTPTVQAQRALADSEAMFRHAFDDAPIGMALTGLDGSFLRVNKAFTTLVGWTTEQLDGLLVSDITHPDDLAADRANVAELVGGRATSHDVRKRYRRPDGTDVPVVVHAAVVRGLRGRPAHVFAHVLPQ